MDTSYLQGWNVTEQQQRVTFMAHMYKCSGRESKDHPLHGVYTGLWQDFCLKEAGPTCRQMYFDRLNAIEQFINMEELKKGEQFMATLHD
ncbi:MAG: hypothetical protein Unbinned3459contig1000_60 [Prokaryotic dsDNA virus sp.]|nr:MAG: hypothetical protein Unbinned3459contig1000_60 [Prokaryotic dsDNA virus sp.]|tara:strand:+ start:352 stop:621 length:270 start_codon:yes stop_codon:yes gene_type:complete